jgi:DNA-binding LacI/PurR family transcriptional regulator
MVKSSTQKKIKPHVRLSDVARIAGVSPATASLALNGKPVAEETRKLVLSIADELGFEPNPVAKRLSQGLSNGVVSLFSFVVDIITWHAMSYLHYDLAARGYEVSFSTNGQTLLAYPEYTQTWAANQNLHMHLSSSQTMLAKLCRQLPQALIINTDFTYESCDELETYQQRGGTVICLNQAFPLECDQVIFDREENTRMAAEYLIKAGHRDIGFCSYLKDTHTRGRTYGFVNALRNARIPVNNDWFFDSQGTYNEGAGARLAERFLALEKRPTAICIVNDFQASSFVNQIMRAGLKVPQDVSVVSLDGLPASEYAIVKLTTVTRPWEGISAKTIEFLEKRLRDGYNGPSQQAVCTGQLIERESVRFL